MSATDESMASAPKRRGKQKPKEDIGKMKAWLGQDEWDIDLMIRMGVLIEARVVEWCETLTDSPWFKET